MTAKGIKMFTENSIYKVLEEEASGSAKKVLLVVLRLMEKDLNQIIIGGDTLQTIVKECKMSEAQIRNSVSELKKLHIMEATGVIRGEYVVNPTLAIKGDERRVWNFYGSLEQRKGDPEATTVKPPAEHVGTPGQMTEKDYELVGKFYKGERYGQ